MKAIRYHGPNQPLRLEEVAPPKLGNDEVLIRVKAAGICHTDLHFISGLLNLGIAPLTLGHEIAGVVENIGTAVTNTKIGDRVIAYYYQGCGRCQFCLRGEENLCLNLKAEHGFISDGGFAEYVKIHSRNAVPLPIQISFEEAAPVGCSVTTAIHSARLADLKQSENIVIFGVGGVGFGIVQYAHLCGANVIAVGRSESKLKKAKELGADHIINAAKVNVADAIRDITSGLGADIIFELVGIKETMELSAKSLAKRGRLVFIGYSFDSFTIHPILPVILEAKIMGSVGNTLEELYEAVRLVGDGKIKTIVDRVLKLEQFQDGLDSLSKGEPIGRVVLVP
jgi:alcohol dehydrogenase, propanol-preferring